MFRNKEKKGNLRFQVLTLVLCLAFGIFFWYGNSVQSMALGTAKVVANSGRIREKADKTSETVGSVEKGNTLDVISQTTDADGYTWYKVYVNKEKTGYIRADLVTVEGSISTENKTTESTEETTENKTESSTTSDDENTESGGNKTVVGSNNSTTTEKKEETKTETKTETVVVAVNVSETDVASVKVTDTVRVRKGAGTNFDVADVAEDGTIATVSGIAVDSQGKNWYQVSYNKDNKTINGFIREDLVEVQERIETPAEEEQAAETLEEDVPEEENAVENADYHLQYMQNDAGEMDWFLFDNIQGTKQSLTQLVAAVEQVGENEEAKDEQTSTMRMIIIAMAVVIVVLIIVLTIMIFKLRDADYEYDDEEYEDDEYDDDDDSHNDNDNEDDNDDDSNEEEEIVEKKIKVPRIGFFKKRETIDEPEEDEEEDEEEFEEVKPETPVKENNKSWQSKDFLELDDDMEFEFLDL